MKPEDALEALVGLVVDAPPGWGAWLLRTEEGYEVSSLMTHGSRPGLSPGEELVLWLELRPQEAPDFPEAWGDLSLLEPFGLNTLQDYEAILQEARSLLVDLEARAESDPRAAEALEAFYASARRALAWRELADRLGDDPELGDAVRRVYGPLPF